MKLSGGRMAAVAAAVSNKPNRTPPSPPLESTKELRIIKILLIVKLQTPESFDFIRHQLPSFFFLIALFTQTLFTN